MPSPAFACSGFSGYSGTFGTGCSTACLMQQIYQNLLPIQAAGYLTGIYPGKYRSPEAEDLDQNLRNGPAEVSGYFCYRVRERIARGQVSMGDLVLEGLLSIYLPSDVSTSMSCTYQLAEMVLACFNDEASLRDCSSKPTNCVYRCVSDEVDDKILQIEYECTYMVPPTPGND